ncbi:MAG: DUF4340 domain-containing protein [Planctomycetota bacterium]|nr:DUF4340 domain-containing protein [Planctomycetota bacterium]
MSSHLRSLERRTLVFGVLAVVLGAALWLMPEASTSVKKESLPLAFPDFDRDVVKRIELRRGKRDLVMEEGANGAWQLASHFRYAMATPPDRLLDAIASARITSEITRRKDTFDKYAGGDGWIDVVTIDNRGQETARFGIGRYKYPETFVRLGEGDEARIVKATSVSRTVASLEERMWIETRMWPALSAKNMIRIDVEQRRDKRTISLIRRGESPVDVEMAVPEKDEKGEKVYWMAAPQQADAKTLAVEDLGREFTGMLIREVVAGSLGSKEKAEFGFDDPEIVATLYHKVNDVVTKHVLTVGKRVPGADRWWVRRGNESWVFLVEAGSGVSRMRQGPEEFLPQKEEEPKKDGEAVEPPK